nr:MAG TPA: hypothetical protein [Caudoviricetes sp.]
MFKPNDFLLSIPWKYHRFLALLLKFSVTQKYGRRGLVALAPIFQFSAI